MYLSQLDLVYLYYVTCRSKHMDTQFEFTSLLYIQIYVSTGFTTPSTEESSPQTENDTTAAVNVKKTSYSSTLGVMNESTYTNIDFSEAITETIASTVQNLMSSDGTLQTSEQALGTSNGNITGIMNQTYCKNITFQQLILHKAYMKSYIPLKTAAMFFSSELFSKTGY